VSLFVCLQQNGLMYCRNSLTARQPHYFGFRTKSRSEILKGSLSKGQQIQVGCKTFRLHTALLFPVIQMAPLPPDTSRANHDYYHFELRRFLTARFNAIFWFVFFLLKNSANVLCSYYTQIQLNANDRSVGLLSECKRTLLQSCSNFKHT